MKYAMCPCGCGLTIEITTEKESYYIGHIIDPGKFPGTIGDLRYISKDSRGWIIKSNPENTGLEE